MPPLPFVPAACQGGWGLVVRVWDMGFRIQGFRGRDCGLGLVGGCAARVQGFGARVPCAVQVPDLVRWSHVPCRFELLTGAVVSC